MCWLVAKKAVVRRISASVAVSHPTSQSCETFPTLGPAGLRRADSAISTTYSNATVLSFSRNYLTGTTDMLDGLENLETLCDSPTHILRHHCLWMQNLEL